ncbi:MAG: hypothetical protein BWY30_00460 [Tenericutes bacterium ADurb.Bin239]|nr:MAG: hypothetical protein BWY30_00460 [Tenericutes bacterium ADurb.Bin239]
MKKLFKGLFTTALALGLLAGCKGGVEHNVILSNYNGEHIKTLKVADGRKAKKPADPAATLAPAAEGFTFRGWFVEKDLEVGEDYKAYNWNAPVKSEVRLLALWEGADVYVSFYVNTLGVLHEEIKVKAGHVLLEMPTEPERDEYNFLGWYTDTALETEFDPTAFVLEDTDVYAKWRKIYVPDTRPWHLAGSLANTDYKGIITWADEGEVGVDWGEESYLAKDADSNLFSIEVVIGFRGEFKIKVAGAVWDTQLQFSYGKIRENDRNDDNFIVGDFDNVKIINAGTYKLEIETDEEWLKVTRTGDIPAGSAATPNPAEGTIDDWGVSGKVINDWGKEGPDISLIYNDDNLDAPFYYTPLIKLPAGDFKLRANNDWGLNFGSHPDNVLPEGKFTQPTHIVDEVEVVKTGENITVVTEGWYRIYFDIERIVITEVNFALRGSVFGDAGWNADSEPLAFKSETANEDDTITLVLEGIYTFTDGKFKVKLGTLVVGDTELYSGWFLSFGNAEGQDIEATAGEYTVTLTLVVSADFTFEGSVTFV